MVDASACIPGEEVCNGRDDDCDGRIDERLSLTALGDTVVLREPTELDAGDCPTCSIATSPILVPTRSGYDALFSIATNFGAPTANVFVRELDARGVPTASSRSAGSHLALGLRPMSPGTSVDGRSPIALCTGLPTDPTSGLLLVADDGSITARGYEGSRACLDLFVVQHRVLTLTHTASSIVWTSRSSDATDLRATVTALSGGDVVRARCAASRDRVGILIEQIEREVGGVVEATSVSFAAVSPLAETLVAPARLPLPGASLWDPDLVATDQGWLMVIPSRGGPARYVALTTHGELRGPLSTFVDEHTLVGGAADWAFVADPLGSTIVHVFGGRGRMHVQLLDAQGSLMSAFEDVVPDGLGRPNVLFTPDHRILVTWHGAYNGPNGGDRLYVRELGCGG